MLAIGAGEVIAVDNYSYFPPEAPVVDDLSGFPNVEAIVLFEPDPVFSDNYSRRIGVFRIDVFVASAVT